VPAKNPGYSVRLWLGNEELEDVAKTAERTGLKKVEVMNRMMAAAIKAVRENGYRLSLPLEFQIVEEEPSVERIELNERHGKKK
jgi:hypothetical protein